MPGCDSDVLVILPAYNEREALPGVLADLRAAHPDARVLVVDDGSADGTASVAREAGAGIVLTMPYNSGVGAALRTGLLAARRMGVGAAVQCDADGQHPPEAIGELVAGLADADIVIGARFAGVGDYRVRGPRAWAMRVLSIVMSRLHGTRLTDVTSGFRAFGPRAVDVLSRHMAAQYLGDTVEALMVAREHGLRVRQVPVAMRPRQGGRASAHPGKAALYLLRTMTVVSLALVRRLGAGRAAGAEPEGGR
jgi:glycosyltransferase involved in cell wall biosynthesis